MKPRGSILIAAFALAAAPTFAFADLLFGGAEFIVNTYTTNSQSLASARAVASAADGSFVVVWNSYAAVGGQDGERRRRAVGGDVLERAQQLRRIGVAADFRQVTADLNLGMDTRLQATE